MNKFDDMKVLLYQTGKNNLGAIIITFMGS